MPDAPTAPAPSAPPAAPAKPATPAPAPPAPAAAPSPSTSGMDDPIRAFDKQLTEAFDKAAPLAKKPDAAPKSTETPKAPEAPKTPEPPKQVLPVKQPKELRAELDRVTGELTAKSKQITDMEAKIKEFEAKGKDTTTLTDRLSTLEKQLEDIRAENRALKQETSPEFKQKYDLPFQKAAAYAKRVIEQLSVTNPDTGESRPAKVEDFIEVYNLPYNKAIARAKELFGDGYQLVINHMTELQRLEYEKNLALEEEKSQWKQREDAERSKHIQQQEEIVKISQKVRQELADSVDDYHDDPTDKEAAKAREDAYALFDSKTDTIQQRIIKNNHIRHRFAAFGPMKLKILRLERQLAEKDAELKTYQNEPPDPSRRRGGKEGAPGKGLTWEEEARKELT